ncbi:hypothetical protein Tco_0933624, partial [Tanacetum coccineum]
KGQSEKDNVEGEPEVKNVSLVTRGRGKGYMCIGNQEVNVSRKPKKFVVPRKPRTITVPHNIMEQETMAVELAKSISIEEHRLQQREIMTQLPIEKQIEKDIDEGYVAKRGLKLKGAATEDPSIQSLLALRKGSKEIKRGHVRKEVQAAKDTNKDDDKDDTEDSDMDICNNDSDKGDDDATGFGHFTNHFNDSSEQELMDLLSKPVFTNALTTSVVANPEGNPDVLRYLSGASEVPLGTNVDVQATEFVLQEMIAGDVDQHISSPPVTTTHDLVTNPQQSSIQAKAKKLMAKAKQNKRKSNFKQVVEQKFKEYDQKLEAFTSINVPEAIEEAVQAKVLTEMKKHLPTHVSTTIAKFVKPRINNIVLEDPPNDREGEKERKEERMLLDAVHKFIRTLAEGSREIDKDAVAKKLKELIKKDELTITDLEGVGLEMLKKQYKNYVELEYHVDQLKATMLTEAQWSNVAKGSVAKKLKELIKKDELTITDLEDVGLEMLKKQYKNYVKLEYHVDQLKATMLTEA